METLEILTSPEMLPKYRPYRQYAFKIAIKATNQSKHPRPMVEYRTGYDGTTELDPTTHAPKQLMPGESRWIAIEPSSKLFTYTNEETRVKGWGAAAYPKKLSDARTQWKPMPPDEFPMYHKRLSRAHLVIPYEQIADTLRSLYPSIARSFDLSSLIAYLKKHRLNTDFGFPNKVQIVLPTNHGMGFVLTKRFLDTHPSLRLFPAHYATIPLEPGALVLIETTAPGTKQTFEYRDPKTQKPFTFPQLVRIIDAPARRAAIWNIRK